MIHATALLESVRQPIKAARAILMQDPLAVARLLEPDLLEPLRGKRVRERTVLEAMHPDIREGVALYDEEVCRVPLDVYDEVLAVIEKC